MYFVYDTQAFIDLFLFIYILVYIMDIYSIILYTVLCIHCPHTHCSLYTYLTYASLLQPH